jgi:hypothetical protein
MSDKTYGLKGKATWAFVPGGRLLAQLRVSKQIVGIVSE